MKNYRVTVSLELDVSVPVIANDEEGAEEEAENMSLSEFLEWASCSSYSMNVLEVKEET